LERIPLKNLLVTVASSLTLIGAVVGVWSASVPETKVERELQVASGRTTIQFFTSAIESNGLAISSTSTAQGSGGAEPSVGFSIKDSSLSFRLDELRLEGYIGGEVTHTGGVAIRNGKNVLEAKGFSLLPSNAVNNGLSIAIMHGKTSIVAFELTNPKPRFDVESQTLVVSDMDMTLTLAAAQKLGRPDLVGMLVGTVTLIGEAVPIDGGGPVVGTKGEGGEIQPVAAIDVAISSMGSLTVLGRLGTFPNGRNGLSMSTTSCNVGTSDIPWNAPMQETHPVIAMNLYRVLNGRFEQVGWSWLKHGFLATNSPNCGTCQHPGTGSRLGPGCSDTYGTGNNGDRFYLGARGEVNPFAGTWECTGSWFSDFQNDCVRRRPFSGEFTGDPVTHRLEVLDGDLGNAGAQYYYEAYYINANDFDRYNNVSSRSASFSWSGSSWSATTTDGGQTLGPAINRWGDLRSFAEPRTDGDVIVAVDVTDNGNGTWHFEYAVYNHDLDRQVDSFSIPLPFGASVTNVGFRDIDQNAGNQWTPTVTSSAITWETGNNPLTYSSVFNFRFDANVQPATTNASLGMFKPGGTTEIVARTMGPLVFDRPASYVNVNTGTAGGTLASLFDRDDNRLNLTRAVRANSPMGIQTSTFGPLGAVTLMTIGVESSDTTPAASGSIREVQLFDWISDQFVTVDTRVTTMADTFYMIDVTTNVSRYVNASTREVRARFLHVGGLSLNVNRPFAMDMVGIHFN
jgi:hypothetical protein